MSDYEVLTASDATSRSASEERNVSDPVLHASPYRHVENGSGAERSTARHLGRRAPQSSPTIDPEHILRSFNTWAFKREQPSDPPLMLQFVARAVAHDAPIPILFYWGKGPRCAIDAHDHKCLDYLGALGQRISAAYEPGAAMRLIFTDTHARLNGYSDIGIRGYFAAVEAEARRRGYECSRLGALIEKTNAKSEDYTLGDVIPGDMLEKLSASAMKWYHGAGTSEQGAAIYFHMNMIEKRAVELAFPDAIFATFNSSKFRILFPKRLPIFYMYSMQRGVSVKPWFLPAEATPCDEASCRCKSGTSQNR